MVVVNPLEIDSEYNGRWYSPKAVAFYVVQKQSKADYVLDIVLFALCLGLAGSATCVSMGEPFHDLVDYILAFIQLCGVFSAGLLLVFGPFALVKPVPRNVRATNDTCCYRVVLATSRAFSLPVVAWSTFMVLAQATHNSVEFTRGPPEWLRNSPFFLLGNIYVGIGVACFWVAYAYIVLQYIDIISEEMKYRCSSCGYIIHGIESVRCPECGTLIERGLRKNLAVQ